MLSSLLRLSQRRTAAPAAAAGRRAFAAVAARNPALASWTAEDKAFFQQLLRPENVLTEADDTEAYTVDWLKKYKAASSHQMVLRPKSTEQVSAILKYCNERRLPVVPQGGNTGLVGGSVPVHDEIVVSTSAMNSVISFDEVSGILVCEAGCVLENLDNYVAKHGYMMPLDLGAKGTCQIGGNVSANAGGLRLLRYGSLHGTVLGVEAVLADGTVIDCLSKMRKDNTGYDLKQLFIGSEGTLGLVTKVSILTPPRSSSVNVALLGCEDFSAVKKAFVEAKKHLGEVLSAIEFFDRQSLDMVLSQQDWVKDPLESSCPFYVLIETSGSNSAHDMEKLEAYLEDVMGAGVVVDGTVAQDAAQGRKLFMIREDITVALSSRGYVYKYDISLPMDQYYKIVEETREKVEPLGAKVVGYGHLGDSNLHLNVSTLAEDDKVFKELEPYVFEWTCTLHVRVRVCFTLSLILTHRLLAYSPVPRQHQRRARHRDTQAVIPAPVQVGERYQAHEADEEHDGPEGDPESVQGTARRRGGIGASPAAPVCDHQGTRARARSIDGLYVIKCNDLVLSSLIAYAIDPWRHLPSSGMKRIYSE
jgi:D-2-hydroxyglutarate dehydrogenase